MKIGFVQSGFTTIGLTGAGGQSWLTVDAGAALIDGIPSRRARLKWPTATGQTTATTVALSASGSSQKVGLIGLLNVTLPAGLKILFRAFKNSAVVASISTTVQSVGGIGCAWGLFVGNVDADMIHALVYNDVGGAAVIQPGTAFDLGEFFGAAVFDVDAGRDWKDTIVDPSASNRNRASRVFRNASEPYRVLSFTFAAEGVAKVRGKGLPDGYDWAQLRWMFARGTRAICVPRFSSDLELAQTVIFGTAALEDFEHMGGDYYTSSATFEQIP